MAEPGARGRARPRGNGERLPEDAAPGVGDVLQRLEALADRLDEGLPPARGPASPIGAPPPPTPPGSPSVPSEPEDVEDPRRVAHELLGQAHAVLTVAVRPDVMDAWCPPELRESVLATTAQVGGAIGQAHVTVGSGDHDVRLREAGIGDAAGRPKRLGLRQALRNLVRAVTGRRQDAVLRWLKISAGWGKNALSSLATAIPGAELAAEALDLVITGIDTREALDATDT
jgi:hypothetical protein